MWWLDPGKEVLNVLFNRILAPYVENLDLNQVNYGIAQGKLYRGYPPSVIADLNWSGQLTLRNLRLKRGVLDKFQMPVDVVEGHLGKFTLSLHWMNLGNQPVEVLIEDVYLLVVPSAQTNVSQEEEEKRAQAAKAERLENAELLHIKGDAESQSDSPQTQGLLQSLITKVINNLQVTVRNIHIRYEDSISVPGHPFAAGITLAGFAAVSVNDQWQPVFIESTAGAIHKLARLQSLAVYVDTDSQSMAGLGRKEAIELFSAMIHDDKDKYKHQYVLKPVSGEGRVVVNHKIDRNTPRFNIELLFDEIGVALDDDQYRDAISLVDMYHVYMRKHQYRKYQPSVEAMTESPARARLRYAADAILAGVKEKRKKWTWAFFAGRRDDRNRYVELFQKKSLGPLLAEDLADFEKLEIDLSYEDIRFYRSIARSRLRKDQELRKRIEADKKKQQEQTQKQGWGSWLWGSTAEAPKEDPLFSGNMTEEQRKELYDVLDYDEKSSLMEALQAPRDSLKMQVTAKLKRGSFALRTDPHGECTELISIVFDVFNASFIQRHGNFETTVSLQDLRVFDGVTKNTLYPQIVRVKKLVETVHTQVEPVDGQDPPPYSEEPFFLVKFENNPLDDRADSALTIRMRHMEIIYHKGYIEAIYKFFKPPASQLESVEALLNAASQTLEGLRKETRAGLEYALQTHKTVDIQVDMNAPIIIIPEDITTSKCTHLIIDAGHIAVESELGDKKAIQTIHQKRTQRYTDEDYKNLESLMYDKLSLNLQDAQFVLGNSLDACRAALADPSMGNLHVLERINIGLQIQKSIVPSATNLTQFKVVGNLPSLQVNFSDLKYRSLMRLIDVCIPKFDGDLEGTLSRPPISHQRTTSAYNIPTGFFERSGEEYNVDDEESDEEDSDSDSDDKEFFEAEGGSTEPQLHQRIFQLAFQVGTLRASVFKTNLEGVEKPLGNLSLEGFSLLFVLHKYHMNVDVNLRSISTNIIQPSGIIKFISTPTEISGAPDLLQVKYTRVQRESPEFQPIYEGIDQNIDVKISTLVFRVAPEPILATYDFIMTTFVPRSSPPYSAVDQNLVPIAEVGQQNTESSDGKIRVLVKLESVKLIVENDFNVLATLNLSVADVAIFTRGPTLRVSGRLGNLTLANNNERYAILPQFNQILSIEGQQKFADFVYETFDPESESYSGVKSSFRLNAASLKMNFLEGPLHSIYIFLLKLARLKYLYDAATTVAVQKASEMDRTQFTISIKTPILIFPTNPSESSDFMTMRLGHIEAKNSFEGTTTKTLASLHGILLDSLFYSSDNESYSLKIIDDINVDAEISQTTGVDRGKDITYPDTQISVKVSDVKLHLTQKQYMLLVQFSRSIPRTFSDTPDSSEKEIMKEVKPKTDQGHILDRPIVDLQPELRSATGGSPVWTSLDLLVTINAVKLHLYDGFVNSDTQLKEHGIARFALNDNSLRLKQLNDGSMEAQVILRSFTMSNTRPGGTKYREIIPAAQHERNQFMLLYSSSASYPATSQAVLTVDSPQIIFAVDPVFMLIQYFTSPFSNPAPAGVVNSQDASPEQPPSSLNFRVDLHEVSISVLENDLEANTRAIRLSIDQILFSQEGIIALNIQRLGMSLVQMGRQAESARFLDEVDLTISLDSRSTSAQQMTSVEVNAKPIVFRASYRDINLITTIFNRALELYNTSQSNATSDNPVKTDSQGSQMETRTVETASASPNTVAVGKAKVVMSKEHLKGMFEGFRLILIGDMHEQPMLHLKVKPFVVGVKDWSGGMHATTTLATQITYWNLTNSHWEPLIDPWTFTTTVSKDSSTGSMSISLNATSKLDINLSTTFAELALNTLNTWNKEGATVLQKPRGVYAPYRIRNSTGASIFVWSDTENSTQSNEDMVKISNNEIVDWRFGDWRTTREHVSSTSHTIGIQFVEHNWEPLKGIPVEREGEYVFSLRPRTEKYPTRVLFDVKVVDNTKIVTIRSTYKVENLSLYPLELMLVDEQGHPVDSLERVVPGQEYALPIDAVTKYRVRIQPDQGFGYKWSPPLRWEDLIAKKSFTVKCPHGDPKEAAFRFQAWVQTDASDLAAGKYPKITLRLRAPLELENLLPYNLEYRIYDKNTNQNWRSYLRKGGIMPIHSVELAHFILLNVTLQDSVFKPSEFAIVNTDGHSDFDIERKITLKDRQDRKLDLRLNYVRYPDSGGAFKVQIYSPYIVVNKTGLPYSVRSTRSTRAGFQDAAGDTQPDSTRLSAPFLLSHSHSDGHEFTFKFGDSAWSRMISLEAPSAETELTVSAQRNTQDQIFAGLSWSEGLGKYKLTKVIVLMPRFLVRNNLSYPVVFRQHGVVPRDRAVLAPGERAALRVLRSAEDKMLTIAHSGLNAQWTPPISLEDIGSVYVRLTREQSKTDLIQANVVMEGSTIFVLLSEAEDWPFEIENVSDALFELRQQDTSREPGKDEPVYYIPPHSNLQYAWDFPAAKEKRLMIFTKTSKRVIDIMEIGDLVPFKFMDNNRAAVVSLDVRADGKKQILRISNYNPERSLYRPKQRAASTSLARQDTFSSNEGFEAVTKDVTTALTFTLDWSGIGISLINKRLVEVVYMTIDNLKFEYTDSSIAQAVNLTFSSLQIDNQLHDALFPVILQPTPLGKESADIGALPTVQAFVIWLKDQAHGVFFVKYCSVLIQALTIEADEDLLFAIYDLTQIKGASWEVETQDTLIAAPGEISDPSVDSAGQELYFEVLELQPIKLSLSFMRTERVSSEAKMSIRNPLAVIVNALTMTVGNINDAPLELNALGIKDMRLSTSDLQTRIFYHYRQDVLRQLYRILGSADFIGNPVGLFTNVSSGVADIFYEPFQGVVMHGNRELGIGIAKGAASFLKKTVFGVSDSVTKFTSSVGKGLSAATFDSEYQARRRMTQRRNRPRHAIYGVAAGGEAFASSVTSAMEGVFMKPIEGAESGGALGFFKGVGKGLVGAVTKPVVGVFDLASNVSEGIRNTTTVFDNPDRDRVRVPRLTPSDGVLKSYSSREASGQYWMKDLNNGAYRNELYVAHINSPVGDNVVLLTQTKVLSFYSRKLRLDWELPFNQIQGVTAEDNGIRFAHRLGREHDKFALIPDKASQTWFFNQVATVVRAFNARRRMDA